LKFRRVNLSSHFGRLLLKLRVFLDETLLTLDMVTSKDSSVRRGTAVITSPNGDVTIRIRTRPLPKSVTEFLLKHADSMNHFLLDRRTRIEEDVDLTTERVAVEKRLSSSEFKIQLEQILSAESGEWKNLVDRYISTYPP
jgi:hypothetical protein